MENKIEEPKVQELTMIEKAEAVAERIETANKLTAELLDKQEKIKVREIMGGQSQAGIPQIVKTQEEKSIDSAREMLKGTGYDDLLFPVQKNNGEK